MTQDMQVVEYRVPWFAQGFLKVGEKQGWVEGCCRPACGLLPRREERVRSDIKITNYWTHQEVLPNRKTLPNPIPDDDHVDEIDYETVNCPLDWKRRLSSNLHYGRGRTSRGTHRKHDGFVTRLSRVTRSCHVAAFKLRRAIAIAITRVIESSCVTYWRCCRGATPQPRGCTKSIPSFYHQTDNDASNIFFCQEIALLFS